MTPDKHKERNQDFTTNVRRVQLAPSSHELLGSLINIPQDDKRRFNFHKLWAFTGPGVLMSICFLDPGNLEVVLIAGSQSKYKLFWVLAVSTLLGILIQRLSARVGSVTGRHIAELCYTEYRQACRLIIWIMLEVELIGCDIQEVIGATTAIYLLSQGLIPPWGGVLFTVVEVFFFIFLDKYGLRKLELFFCSLITIMAVTFSIEFFLTKPDYKDIAQGLVIPQCSHCTNLDAQLIGSLIGVFIVPHAVFLHSGLVKTRNIDRSDSRKISEANFYYLIEMCVGLTVAFIIALLVMAIFAKEFYGKTNSQIYAICKNKGFLDTVFPNNSHQVDANIESGGVYLGCQYGEFALYIWSIGMIASAQSSTIADCYSGQFIMEGFLNLKWVRWKRVVFTRGMSLLPTLYLANYTDLAAMSQLNNFLNTFICIQLPFALLPTIAFSSNQCIMGQFANSWCTKLIAVGTFVLISSLNGVFISNFITVVEKWPMWTYVIGIFYSIIYAVVCLYLLLHTAAALTSPHSLLNTSPVMKRFILGKSMTKDNNSEAVKAKGTKEQQMTQTSTTGV